jgi:hypothetical protein
MTLIEQIVKLVKELSKDRQYDGYQYHSSVAVCSCGHVTCCATCSSSDARYHADRLSEIGR